MRIDTKHCRLGGLLLLALATMCAAQWQPDTSQSAARNNAAQLTRAQVVDQIEPLCRALFPDQDVLRFLASPASVYHRGNRSDTLWTVECLDTDSHVIARVLWNTDTKRALQFGPTMSYTAHRQGHAPLSPVAEKKVDKKKAVAIAREWASRLRPVSGEELLRSEYQTECVENTWSVRLHLSDGVVMVWVNAGSGELHNAIVQDAPTSRHPEINASPP